MTPASRGVLATAFLLGCTVQPTQLVVIVDTDMTAEELDGFSTRVLDGRGQVVGERTFARGTVPPAVLLPATFGVAPKDRDADRRVTVEVVALHAGDELFRTRAVTGFIREQALALDMFLAERCVLEASTCGTGRTCRRTGCEDEVVDPDTLSRYRDPDLRRDASVADASVDAAARDAEPDAPLDAGEPSAVPWTLLLEGEHLLDVVDGAVDEAGTFYGIGDFRVAATIGSDGITALGDRDGFVVAIARDGTLRWALPIGGAGATVSVTSVAVDPRGGVWVGGTFAGVLESPGVVDSSGPQAGFLLLLDSDGTFRRAHAVTSSSSADVESIAMELGGRIAVGGAFTSDLSSALGVADVAGSAGFVGILDEEGGGSCLVPVTSSAAVAVTSVTWTPEGLVAAAGAFASDLDAGGLSATVLGPRDAFVASFDGLCAVQDLGTLGGTLGGVRIGATGRQVLLASRSAGELLSPGAPPAMGSLDVARARVDPQGELVPLALDGGPGIDTFADLFARDGAAWVTGSFTGDATLGSEAVTSVGVGDGFVLVLDDLGVAQSVLQLGGAGADSIQVVATDGDGALLVAGSFQEHIELGAAGALDGTVATSWFAARLPP